MTELIAGLAGAAVTAIGLRLVPRVLKGDRHIKTNFRGRAVVATGGAVLILPLVAGAAIALLRGNAQGALTMAAAALAMAGLGLLDDLYGDRHAGGLIGHAKALLKGHITTGLLKAGGGALLGLAAAAALGWRGAWIILAGAAVALAANMANLFDLRPGRTIKVFVPFAAWLMVSRGPGSGHLVVAAVLAGSLVFLVADLFETAMLGDVGAGLLGMLLGVGAIAVLDRSGLVILLAGLTALTVLSERVSFTRIIEAVPPLRWFDHLGRRQGSA